LWKVVGQASDCVPLADGTKNQRGRGNREAEGWDSREEVHRIHRCTAVRGS